MSDNLLPPATKLGQGNIFRSVCQELCSQGGLVSQHALQVSRLTPKGGLRGLACGVSRLTPKGGLRGLAWGVSRPTPGGL